MQTRDAYTSGHLVHPIWDLRISSCWDQTYSQTCHDFSRLSTSKMPWYFLDLLKIGDPDTRDMTCVYIIYMYYEEKCVLRTWRGQEVHPPTSISFSKKLDDRQYSYIRHLFILWMLLKINTVWTLIQIISIPVEELFSETSVGWPLQNLSNFYDVFFGFVASPLLVQVSCFIYSRQRVAVTRHRMIYLVLWKTIILLLSSNSLVVS